MVISIVTVVYNGETFISECIRSVLSQTYPHVEYIVVDGGSTDGTIRQIKSFGKRISTFISEKDLGIYDAMNKGIAFASGDIIGILNADDFFSDQFVLADVARTFAESDSDIVYGDLFYVHRTNSEHIVRRWIGRPYKRKSLLYGWMPAHPTFYARRHLFETHGGYDLSYGSAADYELMLRFLYRYDLKAKYLKRTFVQMRAGGVSNRSLSNRIEASLQDYRAMRTNDLPLALMTVFMKPLRKLFQFSYFFNFKLT